MPIGAGLAPAGSSAAGYGVPDAAIANTNGIFPDPLTGVSQTGRLFDTSIGSYDFTADGRTQGEPTVKQQVKLALKTVLHSSSVQTLGIDFSNASEQGTNFLNQIASAVAASLSVLVRNKLVTIVRVFAQPVDNNDGTAVFVGWIDNTNGQYVTNQIIGP
jgi:hypothetical protein